jgi:maltose O-acetyltransferase
MGNAIINKFRLILYYGFAKHLPSTKMPGGKLAKKIRYHICRTLFQSCGNNVNIEAGARFGIGKRLSIGNNSGLGVNSFVVGAVKIGENVMMGPEVVIMAYSHSYDRCDIPMNLQGSQTERPVTIGDDVWIGTRVVILPGVKIGSGVILGAGAVVSRDVPDWGIAVGNPARIVRCRNVNKERRLGKTLG